MKKKYVSPLVEALELETVLYDSSLDNDADEPDWDEGNDEFDGEEDFNF